MSEYGPPGHKHIATGADERDSFPVTAFGARPSPVRPAPMLPISIAQGQWTTTTRSTANPQASPPHPFRTAMGYAALGCGCPPGTAAVGRPPTCLPTLDMLEYAPGPGTLFTAKRTGG